MTPSADVRARSLHSWLFVPADNARLLSKSATRGADVIICDLEDAVPGPGKPAARRVLSEYLSTLPESGIDICVRVNNSPELGDDLAVAVHPAVSFIMLPKAESPETLVELGQLLTVLEREQGLATGDIGVIALVETPLGILNLSGIAQAPRVHGLALGSEDYCRAMGVSASGDLLRAPASIMAICAAAYQVMALGVATTVRNFNDPDGFEAAAAHARGVGMTGALCIHPRQVAAVNAAYRTSAEEVAWAQSVLTRWRAGGGCGVVAMDGEMIDKPVADRAATIMSRAGGRHRMAGVERDDPAEKPIDNVIKVMNHSLRGYITS
ncbi:HpcH/HpaI aldolase/citrate lyase family protein [Specibacter cremeus]|uniref:HpcH/HpaI aldolase/citrate lyase family protein n=1 Tax=Specibacter cremeus TaxID=1629051 RepID=UPI001F0BA3A0|nr:CoA ester lyase [Specibacter cremeus]